MRRVGDRLDCERCAQGLMPLGLLHRVEDAQGLLGEHGLRGSGVVVRGQAVAVAAGHRGGQVRPLGG